MIDFDDQNIFWVTWSLVLRKSFSLLPSTISCHGYKNKLCCCYKTWCSYLKGRNFHGEKFFRISQIFWKHAKFFCEFVKINLREKQFFWKKHAKLNHMRKFLSANISRFKVFRSLKHTFICLYRDMFKNSHQICLNDHFQNDLILALNCPLNLTWWLALSH